MIYSNNNASLSLGKFLTKITVKAISKIEDADVNELMRIAENVTAWASSNIIDSNQLDRIANALPSGIVDFAEPIPDEQESVEPDRLDPEEEAVS